MRFLRTLLVVLIAPFAALSSWAQDEKIELNVGDEAPDFTLPGTDGEEYTLSEVLKDGPVVLAWFPKADTPGCTQQCKSFKENGHLIRVFDVNYFMISVDPIEDNKKFAQKYDADFAILSDETKETATNYGVLTDWGFSSRHTFYIGTDGKILKIDRKVQPGTTAEDVAANLEELEVDKVESS